MNWLNNIGGLLQQYANAPGGHDPSKIEHDYDEVGSRIGIDTGAYATGRLTALAIEGDRRWVLATVGDAMSREESLV